MDDENTFITKEGLERLKKEFNYLKTEKRKEIAERIREAKELGDLSENAEYTEAKEEQAFVEGKVIELEYVIKNSQVIKSNKSFSTVKIGARITIEANNNEFVYFIVGSNEANPSNGRISNESPLGKAFLDRKVGDVVLVKVPQGEMEYRIIAIE